jgi:hypothetical protein
VGALFFDGSMSVDGRVSVWVKERYRGFNLLSTQKQESLKKQFINTYLCLLERRFTLH